jgi:hypothetical protein
MEMTAMQANGPDIAFIIAADNDKGASHNA